ncbi:hypothetical protein [Flavobacterium sp. PL02]|uniref:hypothetical protein n=1 Tax=Flavobacterium sp. PL02 TaxID=3088354 RepID=UPI002B222E46|nr:hypothetical protein [Flavobacterium sp. PL02]MEA9412609.1 hypothetical protein [Flavobacterium sp. PL02]
MAKNNILKSDSFTLVRQYTAVCKEKDLKIEWRDTEDEAILDALAHQDGNISHRVDIMVQEKQKYILTIGQDKIDKALKLK